MIFHIIRENSEHFLRHPKIVIVASEYITSIASRLNMSLLSDGAAAIAFNYGDDLKVLGSAGKYFPELKHLIRAPIKKENLPPEGCLFFIDVFFVIYFVISINYFDKKKSMILFLLLSVFFVGFISFPHFVKKNL